MNNDILLFTRSPVPYPKASLDYIIYKPIGVYAFRRNAILLYPTLEMGPLERAEDIELLRFVEHGIKIRIGIVDSETIAVDTEKDLQRVRNIIQKLLPPPPPPVVQVLVHCTACTNGGCTNGLHRIHIRSPLIFSSHLRLGLSSKSPIP